MPPVWTVSLKLNSRRRGTLLKWITSLTELNKYLPCYFPELLYSLTRPSPVYENWPHPTLYILKIIFKKVNIGLFKGFLGGSVVKNPPANAGDSGLTVRKISWRRAWQPTPVLLPGESRGQWSLMGYSLWGCKESDVTQWLSTSRSIIGLFNN